MSFSRCFRPLVSYMLEKTCSEDIVIINDDIDAISRVYESFLSEYPLCYGYWKKYANHKASLSSVDQAVEVYEEAVKVATYSVDLWANYCSYAVRFYENYYDVRRLYERSLSFVGKDYLSSALWDQWLAFELSQKQWNHLVDVYIKSLRFPTKRLHIYYKSFKKLVTSLEEVRNEKACSALDEQSSIVIDLGDLYYLSDSKICRIIGDVLDQPAALFRSSTLKIILTVGEYFYWRSSGIDEKIKKFESQIRRPYFHVKPLDDCQVQNWHHYLDFAENKGDFDWTVKLYERCLIPCANYPEFWVRYIECMEASGGREIASHAIERAVTTFLKKVPEFHEYCAKVKEHVGDAYGAHSSLHCVNRELLACFIDSINQQANLEKRLGNVDKAYSIYQKATKMLKDKQDLHGFCLLYAHFARFTYSVTGKLSASREVFGEGISQAPQCKLLFQGLITFMSIHGGKGEVGFVDSIVEHAIVPKSGASLALSSADREEVSRSYLEFVDLCGTTHEIRKAWARHMRLFRRNTEGPELWDKTKKKSECNEAETHCLDRETNKKDSPSIGNLSICSPGNGAHLSTEKKAEHQAQPSMPVVPPQAPWEKERSIEMSQQFHQQRPYPPPYSGFDHAYTSSYQHQNNINIQTDSGQQHPWPTFWEAQSHQPPSSSGRDGINSDHHHHQMLAYHQYQSQWWDYYYQQQQLYYKQHQQGNIIPMQQENDAQLQKHIQLNILELQHLHKKIETDSLKHQQQQQQQHQQELSQADKSCPIGTVVQEQVQKN